jgi:hypothetical protein
MLLGKTDIHFHQSETSSLPLTLYKKSIYNGSKTLRPKISKILEQNYFKHRHRQWLSDQESRGS